MRAQPKLKSPTEKFAVQYGMVHHDLVNIKNLRLEFSLGILGRPTPCTPQRPLPYLFLSGTTLLLSLKCSTPSGVLFLLTIHDPAPVGGGVVVGLGH